MSAPMINKPIRRTDADANPRHDPDIVARRNRDTLRDAGILAVNVLGGPSSGKTSLIAAAVERLLPEFRAGVIDCDTFPHPDLRTVCGAIEQVVRVDVGPGGAVEATLIYDALQRLDLDFLDLLFIENVGSLAPAPAPDVGHAATALVFSVAAGHDVAARHPRLVAAADAVILTKIDLLPDVPFDLDSFRADVRRLNPQAELIEVCARCGDGIDGWTKWLRSQLHSATRNVLQWFK